MPSKMAVFLFLGRALHVRSRVRDRSCVHAVYRAGERGEVGWSCGQLRDALSLSGGRSCVAFATAQRSLVKASASAELTGATGKPLRRISLSTIVA